MWWLWFMDPEDAGRIAIVSIVFCVLFFIGYWIWGPKNDNCNNNKPKYDTIQNDSVIILKKKGHYVYDTINKTDSTITLKRKIIYEN